MIRKHIDGMPEPTSPGEILNEEYLIPTGMTQSALAEKMGVHVQVVNGIVNGRHGVTAETAWKLAKATSTTPQFWMNLQSSVELWEARPESIKRAR